MPAPCRDGTPCGVILKVPRTGYSRSMASMETLVRPATQADLGTVARYAAELVRLHHGYDPQRFMLNEPVEEGYRWWLGRELSNPEAIVLVALREGALVGYAYGRL